MSLEKRLEKLEARSGPPGKFVVVGTESQGKTPAERQAEIDAAKDALGPDDTLIVIEYVKGWRRGQFAETY